MRPAVAIGDPALGRLLQPPSASGWICPWPAVAIGDPALVLTEAGPIRGIGIGSPRIGLRHGLTCYQRQGGSGDGRSADDPCHEGPAVDFARHGGLL